MNFCKGTLALRYFIFHQFLFHKLQKRFRCALKKQRELLIMKKEVCSPPEAYKMHYHC
jgi:hypothetical protein